jgi:aryl-alcohol dehydrogenase-like predicted oxidoreductase
MSGALSRTDSEIKPRSLVSRMVAGRVQSELTLGTAQLGMKYGIGNRTTQPRRGDAVYLVRLAISIGVKQLDTARAYGASESIVKEAFHGELTDAEIITKLDPLADIPSDMAASAVRAAVDRSVEASCRELGLASLPVLLLHRWQHRRLWNQAVWYRLLELHAQGRIGILGASVYEPREAMEALQDREIRHLQLPMNLLDWRWRAADVPAALRSRPDVVVHARSAYLQGVLLLPHEVWPAMGYDAKVCVQRLKELAARFGREGISDLCMAYLRAQPWITSVLTGCETVAQFEHTVGLFARPCLSKEQCEELETSLPRAPAELLNPSQWQIA